MTQPQESEGRTGALSAALRTATARLEDLTVQLATQQLWQRHHYHHHYSLLMTQQQESEGRTGALSAALRTATARVEDLTEQLAAAHGDVLAAEGQAVRGEASLRAQLGQVCSHSTKQGITCKDSCKIVGNKGKHACLRGVHG